MAKKQSRHRTNLGAWLNRTETPVFLLDSRRKLVFFNEGCERLTGRAAADVLGRTCDYAGDADTASPTSLTDHLCPPPEVFADREAAVPVHLIDAAGRSVPRRIHFFPLRDEEGRVTGVLGVIGTLPEPPRSPSASPAQRLHAELSALRGALRRRYGIDALVTRTDAMRRVLEQVSLASHADVALCLVGEPGTGKQHIARMIHYAGEQRARSFVPLDCERTSAFELRQTLKRAYGGPSLDAEGSPPPVLQAGTIYLEHVEHLPRDVQQTVVELDRDVRPGRRPAIRLMAGAERDPATGVDDESLRSDFYHLISTIRIELPPLRRRRDDLEPLAQALLEETNRGAERQVGGFAEAVWRRFREYNWPGNVAELQAVVTEARESAEGPLIELSDLPFRFRAGLDAQAVGPSAAGPITPLQELLDDVERQHIRSALERTRHNKRKAADMLGIPRPRLYRRMQALGIVDVEGEPSSS